MPTKTKTKAKANKAKAITIKLTTFIIPVDDTNGNFDCGRFVLAVQRAFSHFHPAFKYTRPLTVAELEAAEAEAHADMVRRIEDGPSEGIPLSVTEQVDANPDVEVPSVDALDAIGWGNDVACEAQAWEKIANELLVARRALRSTAFTIEKLKRPVQQITHRVLGHTLGSEAYVSILGTFADCKAHKKAMENLLAAQPEAKAA
jgi:hypothetical protein